MLPSLPQRPTARPPSALIEPTICLLIEPASTISTISIVGLSVTRRPPEKCDSMPRLLEHRANLRAAAVHDHRIDARLLQKHHVLGEVARLRFVAHRVAAILHHDDGVVVAQHVRQRLHEDFGLLLRRGIEGLGHRGSQGGWPLLAARGLKLKRFGTPRFLQLLDLTALRLPPILLIELSSCGGRPHHQGREL